MIVKAFIPEAGTRSFTIMDEPLRREACVAGESGAAIVATPSRALSSQRGALLADVGGGAAGDAEEFGV